MALQIGDIAPEFTLYDSGKQKVSLVDFQGKTVVILFYPFAFSSVCTAELCDMRDNLGMYNSLNSEILAISVDSVYTLAKFKDDQQLNFTLLSDFNREVSSKYGALYDIFPALEMRGVSKRAAFVIDKSGVIRFAQVNEKPQDLPDLSSIRQVLAAEN
ncbi:peroxiredoxin [Segetibacter sp. 3557_3]|uniref:redoxin domain-containing protein n=1 Tax=Segetibacter sp. 3557_3 TaxID=2547429 RepID=UPI00105840D7|nr:peroxiredoxin [Segetibacter sp. 3557_3]TDH27875.1 peroxiredoxin [Segetibacter sp. 3557_3]